MTKSILELAIENARQKLEKLMDELLPKSNGLIEDELFTAMRYCVLAPGKRLRPFLLTATAEIFNISLESSLRVATAIEFIHTYSLIHDDLPAMDNDDLRRGQPSCHKKFNEATAILTGDSLLTLAFEVLADERTHPDPLIRIELIQNIALAVGYRGMVGGQIIDLLAQNNKLEYSEVVRLQRMKTGELFSISCEAGGILGRASINLKVALRAYANNLGIIFQIKDDLLDSQSDTNKLGKTVGKDKFQGKSTLVNYIGAKQALLYAEMLAKQAIEHLNVFDEKAQLLRELAKFVITREK